MNQMERGVTETLLNSVNLFPLWASPLPEYGQGEKAGTELQSKFPRKIISRDEIPTRFKGTSWIERLPKPFKREERTARLSIVHSQGDI